MSQKRKRTPISLDTKYKVIQMIDENQKYEQIVSHFENIGIQLKQNNISKIKSQRDNIITQYESTIASDVKKIRKSSFPEIDLKLIDFIFECNSIGLPINTILLKEKAMKIANELKINGFVCSNGYLDRFKKRHSIVFNIIHGDCDGVPINITNEWINTKLPKLIQGFNPNDIYNGDEFGLFWRLLPNKTFKIKGNKFKTGKKSKERISVLVCSNMTGTDKLKLLVIGKAKEPYCFRGKKRVPVIYRNNPSSWMESSLFIEFLKKFNYRMIREKRKIALILDNCPSHPFIELSNIKLIFLPKNTTSVLQPMDMGVIHSIKSKYRVKFCRKLLAILEIKPNPELKDLNLYDAIFMLKQCWDEVSDQTIINAFKKCGFNGQTDITEESNTQECLDTEWSELSTVMSIQGMSFNEYVSIDDHILTSDLQTSSTITSQNIEISDGSDETEIDEIDSNDSEEKIKTIEAMNAISTLRRYAYQSDGDIDNCLEMLNNIEKCLFKPISYLKQTKIDDYFHKNT